MARKAETIRKEIKALGNAYEKLAIRTHRCAGWVMEHFVAHGDTSLMTELVTELTGKGAHRRALIQWFEKWGRVKLQTNGTFKKKDGANTQTIDLDKAMASAYYTDDDAMGRTKQDAKTFNFYGRIKSLIKQAGEMAAEYEQTPEHFKSAPVIPIPHDVKMLERMLEHYQQEAGLDKPQPKADKPLFRGAHKAHEGSGVPTEEAMAAAS